MDNSLYAVKPDRKMELTTTGKKQAYVCETYRTWQFIEGLESYPENTGATEVLPS